MSGEGPHTMRSKFSKFEPVHGCDWPCKRWATGLVPCMGLWGPRPCTGPLYGEVQCMDNGHRDPLMNRMIDRHRLTENIISTTSLAGGKYSIHVMGNR